MLQTRLGAGLPWRRNGCGREPVPQGGSTGRAGGALVPRRHLPSGRHLDPAQRLALLIDELEPVTPIPLSDLPAARVMPERDEDADEDDPQRPHGTGAADNEGLPYCVELWNEAGASVEQVLAVTVNGSIGYAAYYTAAREFPGRVITLRHKGSIISRWDGGRRH